MKNIKFIKNMLPKIMAMLLPFEVLGQSVHITTGCKMVMTGSVKLVLNNTGFVNDGNFTAGNSSVILSGNSNSGVTIIGGNSLSSFYNVAISKSAGNVRLNNDIAINGTINMISGNVELNAYTVNLGNTGNIRGERNQSFIMGSGSGIVGGRVLVTKQMVSGTAFNPGNIGVELFTTNNLGVVTIERRHEQEELLNGSVSIKRSFAISAANLVTIPDIRLRFFYIDEELNGNLETRLGLFTRGGIGSFLLPLGRDSIDTIQNWVLKNGLGKMGFFSLADDQGGIGTGDDSRTANSTNKNSASATAVAMSIRNVYPNPVTNSLTVDIFSKAAKKIAVGLYNESGQLLHQKEVYCAEGINSISWDMHSYAAGVYYLSFKNRELKNIKIIKE
jgi:Secretion system C-terminal sorting domain